MRPKSKSFAKTDVRHWKTKVFRRSRGAGTDLQFSVQIQHHGRREKLPLGTANKDAAASRARDIYMMLQAEGWEPVLEKWKPSHSITTATVDPTVGDLLEAYRDLSTVRESTLTAYVNAFRMIASRIHGISHHPGKTAKWQAKVDAVKLKSLTPSKVQAWKTKTLKAAGKDPVAARRAQKTTNAAILNARSIFAKKTLEFLKERLELPDPLPFDGVTLEKKQSSRYHSKIDAAALVRDAQAELDTEPFKIFLLGLVCGLRRGEIDALEWSAFDFEKGTLGVNYTIHADLKSEESASEIDLDPELISLFQDWERARQASFVIESHRQAASKRTLRAEPHFRVLYAWLREKGVDVQKPLHELRKECGALVNSLSGIYAASRFLRHKDITVTSAHYLDKKEKVTPGLGGLLESGKVVNL